VKICFQTVQFLFSYNAPSQPFKPKLSGISAKLLAAYLYWNNIVRHIPKMRRYSLGVNIEKLFAEVLKLTSAAQFSAEEKRPALISEAITKNDVLKFMLYALWELKGIEENHFLELSSRFEEIGRMLYGWRQKILSENRPPER